MTYTIIGKYSNRRKNQNKLKACLVLTLLSSYMTFGCGNSVDSPFTNVGAKKTTKTSDLLTTNNEPLAEAGADAEPNSNVKTGAPEAQTDGPDIVASPPVVLSGAYLTCSQVIHAVVGCRLEGNANLAHLALNVKLVGVRGKVTPLPSATVEDGNFASKYEMYYNASSFLAAHTEFVMSIITADKVYEYVAKVSALHAKGRVELGIVSLEIIADSIAKATSELPSQVPAVPGTDDDGADSKPNDSLYSVVVFIKKEHKTSGADEIGRMTAMVEAVNDFTLASKPKISLRLVEVGRDGQGLGSIKDYGNDSLYIWNDLGHQDGGIDSRLVTILYDLYNNADKPIYLIGDSLSDASKLPAHSSEADKWQELIGMKSSASGLTSFVKIPTTVEFTAFVDKLELTSFPFGRPSSFSYGREVFSSIHAMTPGSQLLASFSDGEPALFSFDSEEEQHVKITQNFLLTGGSNLAAQESQDIIFKSILWHTLKY